MFNYCFGLLPQLAYAFGRARCISLLNGPTAGSVRHNTANVALDFFFFCNSSAIVFSVPLRFTQIHSFPAENKHGTKLSSAIQTD